MVQSIYEFIPQLVAFIVLVVSARYFTDIKKQSWGSALKTYAGVAVITMLFLPSVTIHVLLELDFLTPWKIHGSLWYPYLHMFWWKLNFPNPIPATPVPEMPKDFTLEDTIRMTNGYTTPVVFRGLNKNSRAVKHWHDSEFWLSNFANESVLCLGKPGTDTECTIQEFFDNLANPDEPNLYIAGAQELWDKYPQYKEWMEDDWVHRIIQEPLNIKLVQMFIGTEGTGSNIHDAMGMNIFKQVVGQKKWWFIDHTYSAFLIPSYNTHGFSSHTKTLVGKDGKKESEWLSHIPRWETVLHPGDVLVNPPWTWHGIYNPKNSKDKDGFIVGCPTRVANDVAMRAQFKNDFLGTFHMLMKTLYLGGGSIEKGRALIGGGGNLGKNIAKGRQKRAEDTGGQGL